MTIQSLEICFFTGNALFQEINLLSFFDAVNVSQKKQFTRSELPLLEDNKSYLFVTDDEKTLKALTKTALRSRYVIYIAGSGEDVPLDMLNSISLVVSKKDPRVLTEHRIMRLKEQIYSDYRAFMGYNMLNGAINVLPDIFWFKGLNGLHYNVNAAFAELAGKDREECEGKTYEYIWNVSEEAAAACAETDTQTVKSGKMQRFSEPLITEGGMRQMSTRKAPVCDMFGNIIGTVGTGHDVTDFNNLGHQLTVLTESLPIPAIMCSSEWKTIRVNDDFRKTFGMDVSNMAGFYYPQWKKEHMTPESEPVSDIQKHLIIQEYRISREKSSPLFLVTEQEIRDSFNCLSGYICFMQDITAERHYKKTKLGEAIIDGLTGLYNRKHFMNYLKRNASAPMTMLYMGLDRFKEVNDIFGHSKGDEILMEAARHIKDEFPEFMNVRIGGDEFASVILENIDDDDLIEKIVDLEEKIKSINVSGKTHLSISIGIDRKGKDDISIDELIKHCDQKMCKAKDRHHSETED